MEEIDNTEYTTSSVLCSVCRKVKVDLGFFANEDEIQDFELICKDCQNDGVTFFPNYIEGD